MDFLPFIKYCEKFIKGDEKGEAQIFLERFFTALGYEDGLRGAGANCEFRVKDTKKRTTSFADLVWKPRVLIEMKKAGEDLSIHYQQVFSYWSQLVPNRPNYVILCNFNEFWIYDFNKDIYDPQEKIHLKDLENRKTALSFLLPVEKKPLFNFDKEDVTEKVAKHISALYISLAKNKNRNPIISDEDAMRYCLQCILCLFAEDIELLPDKIFTRIIRQCNDSDAKGYDKVSESFDLIGGLFQQMNLPGKTAAGQYKGVDYFNGGLFEKIVPIELEKKELELLEVASYKTWQHINPSIFGSIFEGLMNYETRHEFGAHYTHEIDIKKIIDPVIVQPWRKKIDDVIDFFTVKTKDDTIDSLKILHLELTQYKVLDPACGSGNFLFIAYKELKLIEREILKHLKTISDNDSYYNYTVNCNYLSTKQFYGIDITFDAVELAKVTLMIAKELSIKEAVDNQDTLPLDNLDNNIICADALFTEWPECDVIIGNPPYQSKNKMQKEFGKAYINRVRNAYPEVPGMADFCVYWFYKAHKHLKDNSYVGLVGTDTVRQNYSREGSLDYIVNNGGVIFNAISSIKWSGEAAVFVSIVCWKKGEYKGHKILYLAEKDNELHKHELPWISSSLSLNTDVTSAEILNCNKEPKNVFQGQTHGHKGFLLSKAEGIKILKAHPEYKEVIKPFLIGKELLNKPHSQPVRFVIDFTLLDVIEASKYQEVFKIVQNKVLPERAKVGTKQKEENEKILAEDNKAKVNKHHINFLKHWWKLSWGREDMLFAKSNIKRYIASSRVTMRPIFEFVSSEINPNDALMVFAFDDDYSFGIIASCFHIEWYVEKCSTLGKGFRYTTDSVWDTFPWPQNPTALQVKKVAKAAKELRDYRNKAMKDHVMTLGRIYELLEQPGDNPIRNLHIELDKAVLDAYGFNEDEKPLIQLLSLNEDISDKENNEEKVQPPGLPEWVKNKEDYISDDCVKFEWE